MTDRRDDKTRLRRPARGRDDDAGASEPAGGDDDKTRVAPKSGQAEDDKTRVAPQSGSGDDDKTRVAPKSTQAPDDKTRVPPESTRKTDDKTRIAPDNRRPADDKTRLAPRRDRPAGENAPGDDQTRFRPAAPDAGREPATVPPPTVPPPGDEGDGGHRPLEPESEQQGAPHVLKERFVLEKVLGAGGMGVVYKAKDLLKVEAQDRDPYVAIKVLSDEFKSHPEAFVSLQRESRKTQRIAHPNIVNVYDFDRDGDTVFMTMEYMEGEPLDRLLKRYKSTGLPTDDAWQILKGMCSALIYAHAEKIIHSDFKPGNVFVTQKGTAKVFDFGIARAVAQAQHLEEQAGDDRTLFDAGNLGALTPAYASLEMLQGLPPDPRDDIFALACVAYEMFTGEHPFNRVPADEAEQRGLKPERVTSITKRQWKILEKALAFRREDRIASVEEFLDKVTAIYTPAYKGMTIGVLSLALIAAAYFLWIREPPAPQISAEDIRNELEMELRVDFEQQALEDLLEDPTFTAGWEEQLWERFSNLSQLLVEDAPWLLATTDKIYKMYLKAIARHRKDGRFERTAVLIENAARYTDDPAALDKEKNLLAEAEKKARSSRASGGGGRTAQRSEPADSGPSAFDVALENVNRQLNCSGHPDMRNLGVAIEKLRSIDAGRYRSLEPRIVKALAACLTQMGKSFPARARESKKYALHIFNNNPAIAGIEIQARDPCAPSLAGRGARGSRAVCRDELRGVSSSGPDLVVVPGRGRIQTFAIGKYEVSFEDLNRFCADSGACSPNRGRNMPAHNISMSMVKGYLRWLSKKSDRRYRLPTVDEWLHAARAGSGKLDPNRNCNVRSRGIHKGDGLVKISVGRQNAWGLVNHVGNVREWAYASGRRLVALGGSYKQRMDRCNLSSKVEHDGKADGLTGFRVVREMVE